MQVDATAAAHVGKATVSVYVEDTSRRILEANRWMAGLELRSRYRLRSRLSNMVVQVKIWSFIIRHSYSCITRKSAGCVFGHRIINSGTGRSVVQWAVIFCAKYTAVLQLPLCNQCGGVVHERLTPRAKAKAKVAKAKVWNA